MGEVNGVRIRDQTIAPNNRPMPAVMAMAMAPQNLTRTTAVTMLAPPARAPTPPRRARNISEVTDTKTTSAFGGATSTTASGNAAPVAKVRRRQRRLHRPCLRHVGDVQFVARVGGERVRGGQLFGDLTRKRRSEAALLVASVSSSSSNSGS